MLCVEHTSGIGKVMRLDRLTFECGSDGRSDVEGCKVEKERGEHDCATSEVLRFDREGFGCGKRATGIGDVSLVSTNKFACHTMFNNKFESR